MASIEALDPFYIGFVVRALTVIFGVGLAYIAFEAWRRNRRRVLLFVSLAFLAYLARDLIRLSELAFPQTTPAVLLSMTDILDLVTLLLIFFAVARE
mgnify:CR=1 FL=1